SQENLLHVVRRQLLTSSDLATGYLSLFLAVRQMKRADQAVLGPGRDTHVRSVGSGRRVNKGGYPPDGRSSALTDRIPQRLALRHRPRRSPCAGACDPNTGYGRRLRTRYADLRHLPEIQNLIRTLWRQNSVALHHLANEHAFLHRRLADLGRLRVADVRHESRGESCRTLHPVGAHFLICLDSLHA